MTAIVIVHGLRGSHHGVLEIAKDLGADFEVLTPDLPGSNMTAELSEKTLDGYAKWLHKYVSSLPRRPVMVGHSMGSIVVSHYVEKYPDDVSEKVVLLSPIFRGRGGKVLNRVAYGGARVLLAPMTRGRRYKILASKQLSWLISHYLTYDKSKQREIDEKHYKYSGKFTSAEALMRDMRISMHEETQLPRGKENLVVYGMNDRLTSCKTTRRRVKSAGVQCLEISGSGHLINYEKPAEVARAIREFLA